MCCNELVKTIGADNVKNCFEHATTAKEKGKRFRINTQKKVCRIKNDGCLNDNQTEKKCDYIFKVCDTNEVILVELKGGEIDTAIAQIIATYHKLLTVLKKEKHTYCAYIVSSGVPNAAEQKFRQLKEKYKRDINLNIDKKHFKCEISI
jgi:hypothetical protein